MPVPTRTLTWSSVLLLALVGCNGDKPQDSDSSGNNACSGPTANAGVDMAASPGSSITLDGSASVACDPASISYSWTVEAVPVDSAVDNGDLDLTDPAHPTFTPDLVGTYVVSLTVTDSTGTTSSPDLVIIDVSAGSAAPIADCGGNLTANVGDRVNFDGSGSSDPEGAALTYAWTLSGIPECSGLTPTSLYNANTATPSMVPDCAATFLVNLVVSDGEQWSPVSQCAVVVGTGNQAPVAEAGQSGNLSPCTEHTYELDGYGSYDPEGAALTYQWTLVDKPRGSSSSDASFSDRAAPNPLFTWDETGEYTFELRVSDGTLWSAPDIVVLNFQDVGNNAVPIANAGADQSISRSPDCSTASYVFTCEDCPSDDVTLDGSASDDPVDGDELSFAWDDPANELTFAAPNAARTVAYTPSFPAEYNTAIVRTWDVTLTVSDCADAATDTVRVTYTCTGQYSH